MSFEMILTILFAGFLSNNYALLHFLGTAAVVENERSLKKSFIIGLGSTIVMVVTTLITWPINKFLLEKVPYLQTMVFVIVVMLVVGLIHLLSKNKLENFCKVDFMKFAVNGAVLGLCIHNTHIATLLESVITSFAVGLGLTLTMIVFGSLHEKVEEDSVPESFRGLPITLLIAGMMAMALLAITGIKF
jgi:electron transport complex protein RnfA